MKTWKSRGGLGLFVGLCILGVPGCQSSAGPEAHEAAGVVERLRSHRLNVKEAGAKPRPVLPPSGGVRVERVAGGLTVASANKARVVLPEVAQRPFRVKDLASGLTLDVALEGARPAKAEVVDGYVVYPDAHPEGADVVHRFTPEGTEDYLSFERAPSVPEVRYGLTLGAGAAGLRLVADTLEVLDGSGAPRLRMAPPYLVGADGQVTRAHVSVDGCAVDTRATAPWERPVTAPGSRQCRVRVGWSAESVKYPAVLDPVWSTTGSLATARREHTSTVLQDGRVLAVGGNDMGNLISSAELYDPATGTWATTSSLWTGRQFHTAQLLGSGRVLVAGGTLGDPINGPTRGAELYDPATGTWLAVGSMGTARTSFQSALLDDGRVLVMGGTDDSYATVASAELYDPVSNTWGPVGSLLAPRYMHEAVLLSDGKVLVFGGAGYTTSATSSELYDPATGTWAASGSMSAWFNHPLGIRLDDGRVLVVGGDYYTPASELYDPVTGTWSPSAGAPSLVRQEATISRLPDGRVLVVGGMSGTSNSADTATPEVYDPTTGTWSFGTTLGTGRTMHSTSVLQDGRVLVVGGMGLVDYATLASAELLLLNQDDVTAPTVTVTAPSEGSPVEGEVTLTASASDDYAVKRVEFYVDDTLLGTDTTEPYSFSWYTQGAVANGSHVLMARAYDASGNVGASAPVSITVNNDVTPPVVTITSPAVGSVLQGVVTVAVEASDERWGEPRVNFWDGTKLLGSDTTAPYSLSWDLTQVPGGPHNLIVKAYDVAGNEGTASITVTVSQPGTASYDSTLQVPRCVSVGALCDSGSYLTGRGTLEPELNQPNTLQGSCADGPGGLHYDESLDRIRVYTADGSPFEPGKQVTVEVSVWATYLYRSDYLDLYYAADANNPVWTYLTTMMPGGSNARKLYASYVLPSGAVQAVRGRFRYGGSAMPCGSGGYDDHDDLVFAVATDVMAPTVSLTAPSAGSTVSGTATVSASASDNRGVIRVEFFDGATLLGTDTTAPYALSWNTAGVSNGGHTLMARAYDAAGNVGQSAQVQVAVNNVQAPVTTAAYDTVLGAPRCASSGASCDSGTLLNGRAGLGPEANAPNTVDTCTDGAGGGYHSDESLDRLKVSTLDGTAIAVGKTIQIDATVWAFGGYSSDFLDLYYAPDASAPSWTFLGTMPAIAAGAHVLSKTYTLAAGSSRAVVRGVFRYNGSAGTCSGGYYTDVDDLVFVAQ
jgi:hypothetical protein